MRESWQIKPLGDLCQIQLGKTPHRKTEKFWDKDKNSTNIWLSISDLIHGKEVFDSKEYVSDEGKKIFKITPKGTLMLSFKLTLGRVSFAGKDLLTNEAIASLINLDASILKQYLFYYFCFFDWDLATRGDVKLKGKTLNKKKLENLEILIPPIEVQKEIVEILDKAFESIEKAKANIERNIENAKELFQSKLNQIFSKTNEAWEKNTLKELTTKIGSGATPRGGKSSYKETGVSLIRSMNVHDIGFKKKNLAFIDDEQAAKLNNVTVEQDDVLLNITGASVARCCIIPKEYLPARVNQHVSIIRLDGKIIPSFVHYSLTSKYNKKLLLGIGEKGGSTRQAITKSDIESFVISYPFDKQKQKEIIETLDIVDNHIQSVLLAYDEELKNLEELKKSILQKAFSGELTNKNKAA